MSHTLLRPVARASLLLARPAPFPRLVLPDRRDPDAAPLVWRPPASVAGAVARSAAHEEDPERWDGLA
jgi:hypothetical protein